MKFGINVVFKFHGIVTCYACYSGILSSVICYFNLLITQLNFHLFTTTLMLYFELGIMPIDLTHKDLNIALTSAFTSSHIWSVYYIKLWVFVSAEHFYSLFKVHLSSILISILKCQTILKCITKWLKSTNCLSFVHLS